MTQKYDLIIIGGGPGGYLAAERAARGGLKTLLLEKRALGGVCLNEGCIPSKTLLQSAKTYRHALDAAAYGVTCGNVSIDQQAVKKRKDKVVGMLVSGVRGKMASAGVTVVMENAVITGKTSDGFTVAAGGTTYTGKELILATGSSPAIPPIPGIKENLGSFVLTNREILELTQIPKRLTVIGGGVIGLEMAAYFASVGGEVTVVEQLEHIAGSVDRELGRMLQRELERQGVTFLLGHSCLSVTPGSVTVQTPEGAQRVLEADKVLLSVGRRPNTRELGLETVGVSFTPGGIPTDTQCRTNVPGIWAIGDVNGHHMLAHTAYREAEVAVSNILGKKDAMRYNANPSVIYTQPEIASVGKTEEDWSLPSASPAL